MIAHSLVATVLSLLVVATAEAQSLKIGDRRGARSFTTQELLASPVAGTFTVGHDTVHGGRAVAYRVIPIRELLKGLEVDGRDYVDFVATDQYLVGIPARLFLRPETPSPQAFLAIEEPGRPWPASAEKAGPFLLVWQDAKPGEISPDYWVQRLAAIEIADSPARRWPSLELPEDLPALHPARRGLDRYVTLCISCHRFKGTGQGEQGPDLGQPMNPVDYFQPQALRKFLRSSKQVRDWPDRKMPSFTEEVLNDHDMDALIAWLTYKARN